MLPELSLAFAPWTSRKPECSWLNATPLPLQWLSKALCWGMSTHVTLLPSAVLGSRELPAGTPQGESPQGRNIPVVAAQGAVGTGRSGLPLQPSGWAKERGVLGQEVLPGKVKGQCSTAPSLQKCQYQFPAAVIAK